MPGVAQRRCCARTSSETPGCSAPPFRATRLPAHLPHSAGRGGRGAAVSPTDSRLQPWLILLNGQRIALSVPSRLVCREIDFSQKRSIRCGTLRLPDATSHTLRLLNRKAKTTSNRDKMHLWF